MPQLCIASRISSHVAMWDSPKVPTRGFLVKKEGMWRNLSNMPQILYFFVCPFFSAMWYRLNLDVPMGHGMMGIMSMGNWELILYKVWLIGVLSWALLVCSMGSIFGEINGVHIVVGVWDLV